MRVYNIFVVSLTCHQVTSMVNLQWLALNDNLLEGLPKEIGSCSKLERLHLMSNRLVVHMRV